MPFESFYTGYRATVRQPDELIVAVEFPAVDGRQWWRKVGTRRAQAISKVMIAGVRGAALEWRSDRLGPVLRSLETPPPLQPAARSEKRGWR